MGKVTNLVTVQEKELITKFEISPEQIAALTTKFKDITFDTPANYEVGRLAIAEVRDLRIKIEKTRVDLKEPVLEMGRLIDKAAKSFSRPVQEIEDRLEAAKKVVDDAKAKAKADAERAELIALEAQQKKDREAAEAKAKAEREADEKRIAEAAAKLAADQARIDAANKAIAEQQRLERERLDKQRADQDAERQRLEGERQAAEKVEADRQEALRAEQAKKDAEAAAVEAAARAAAAAPDIEKLKGFELEIRALAARTESIAVESEEVRSALTWGAARLIASADILAKFKIKGAA
jgi:hypothetical protein